MPVYVWTPTKQLIMCQVCGDQPPLHLLYTGRHYAVLSVDGSWKRAAWQQRLRWQIQKYVKTNGAGGMKEIKGDNAAAIRTRISQKVAREGAPQAAQLIQKLWAVDESEVRSVRGPATDVHSAIMKLASKHKLSYGPDGWACEEDRLYLQDPWSRKNVDEKDDVGLNDKNELIQLKSTFLGAKKQELPKKSIGDLTHAFDAVLCVANEVVGEVVNKAREVAGSVVVLSKGGLQPVAEGVKGKRV